MRNIRISEKQDQALQRGESALSGIFYIVIAILLTVWLCHDNLEQVTAAAHHEPHEINVLHWMGLV